MAHHQSPIPIPEADLARVIAGWVQCAPKQMLVHLADTDSRDAAALTLGEWIAAEMTMTFPELVESSAPPLPF